MKYSAPTKPAVPRYSTPALPTSSTIRRVVSGPTSAPSVPPAAMKPNSRRTCSLENISSRKLQNTDTRIRFSTLMQT